VALDHSTDRPGLSFVFCVDIPRPAHRFRVISDFSSCKNGPEAEIDGRWRHLAEVTRPNYLLNPVCYSSSADIPRPVIPVFAILTLFGFAKINGPEAEVGGSWRHPAEVTRPNDRPTRFANRVLWTLYTRPALAVSTFELLMLFQVAESETGGKWRRLAKVT
jgi:hypothetical protein